MACTAALSFFQNTALDRESNPHVILIRFWFLAPWNCKKGAVSFEIIRYFIYKA